MPVPRSLLPLLLAGPLALPGCVLPVVATGPVPTAKPAQTAQTPAPAAERFAEFVTAPGQRVPLTETPPAPVVAQHTAPVEPPPGTVARPDPPAVDTGTMQTAGTAPILTGQPVGRTAADPPVLAALRAHLDDRPAAAADHLRGLPRDSQQLLAHLLPAAAAAGRGGRASAVVSRHVAAAAETLESAAPLAVRKAVFVERVRKYGEYDPLPAGYQFLSGGGTQALLYLELDHPPQIPTDHPAGGRGYVIRLDARTRIRDAAGRPVTQPDPDTRRPQEELTFRLAELPRSPVRDYYCTFAVTLPSRPGQYQLTVELRSPDDPARPAAVTVPFQVGG